METSTTPRPLGDLPPGDGGDQVVVALGVQHGVFHDRAGGQNARDLALDQPLRQLGVFDLVADGGLVALGDQPGDVPFQGVVRDAGHRDARPGRLVLAPRQRDLQFAGDGLGVLAVGLIEVADAHQQTHIGPLGLDLKVLPHHRRQVVQGNVHRTGVRFDKML